MSHDSIGQDSGLTWPAAAARGALNLHGASEPFGWRWTFIMHGAQTEADDETAKKGGKGERMTRAETHVCGLGQWAWGDREQC